MPVPIPPQAPLVPPPPAAPPTTAAGHVDLDKIILPKKPGTPSLDSAQRINAGVLFEQERTATLPEPQKPAAPAPQPQKPKAEETLVKPLQTYQSDIESLVGEKQVSVVSIAAAEAERRGLKPLGSGEAPLNHEGRPWIKKTLIVAASLLLLSGAGGIGFYIYARLQPVPLSQQMPAPFISVDDTQTIVLQSGDKRQQTMNALIEAKSGVSLSLGLMARIQITKPGPLGDGTLLEVSAPEFLQTFAPQIPLSLVRTLEPQMLVGVHSYDENQAFMILKADSYETAYSGMLAWEASLYSDLVPLFVRKPAVRIAPASIPQPAAGTTTASTTQTASSTAQAPATPRFSQGNFIDQIVENRDARVLLNPEGDILLLWTMLDRSTIVIVTNEATLREVVSRISQANLISLPPAD